MKGIFCILILWVGAVYGQKSHDLFSIRDYRYDLAITMDGQSYSSVQLSAYGELMSKLHSGVKQSAYIYQGQEYDGDLGLYLFPSRVFDAKRMRFMQPDPESQYMSPYRFVGSDPVNYVDMNGKAAKPLVLYYEDPAFQYGIPDETIDLMHQAGDAHYVPMSDFLNDKVGDLAEWDGNVFIHSPTSTLYEQEIGVRTINHPKEMKGIKLRPKAKELRAVRMSNGKYRVSVSARRVGAKLRNLSDRLKVPVKNVTLDGNEGGVAADRVGWGFIDEGPMFGGNEIVARGLDSGMDGFMAGPIVTRRGGSFEGLSETRYHMAPTGARVRPRYVDSNPPGMRPMRFEGYEQELENGSTAPVDYIGNRDIPRFVRGRIPSRVEDNFRISGIEY